MVEQASDELAARAREPFWRLVAVGVATWLAGQVVQNVGMNLGLLPVTGLPLPFVSYGGSSMLVSWLAIGLVDAPYATSARRRRRRSIRSRPGRSRSRWACTSTICR